MTIFPLKKFTGGGERLQRNYCRRRFDCRRQSIQRETKEGGNALDHLCPENGQEKELFRGRERRVI